MTRRPAAGLLRTARVGVLGSASLVLGTGAHLLGGGRLPGVGVLAVAAVVLGMTATALTARRCRFGVLLLVLTVQQLALHVVLTAAGHASVAVLGEGHALHGVMVMRMDDVMATSPAMLLAHLVATAATAWLLARGEACLWAVGARIVAAVGARPTRRRVRPAHLHVLVSSAPQPLRLRLPGTPLRGPPVTFAHP